MNNDTEKTVFISYSHDNRSIAENLAKDLIKKGIDVWWDEWEIRLGDSLVQKIFEEGIKEHKIFVILLSQTSVQSKWVKSELDSAFISRIQGVTRIVPVLIEECDIPMHLRPLKWINAIADIQIAVEEIWKVAKNIREKPELPKTKSKLEEVDFNISGLSKLATAVGCILLECSKENDYKDIRLSGSDISDKLDINPVDVNDAVEELAERGLIDVKRTLGTKPYLFHQAKTTYMLYLTFSGEIDLGYNPDEDVKILASTVAALKGATGDEIKAKTELPLERINRAVKYLEEHGYVKVIKYFDGTSYNFSRLEATGATRRFVAEYCK